MVKQNTLCIPQVKFWFTVKDTFHWWGSENFVENEVEWTGRKRFLFSRIERFCSRKTPPYKQHNDKDTHKIKQKKCIQAIDRLFTQLDLKFTRSFSFELKTSSYLFVCFWGFSKLLRSLRWMASPKRKMSWADIGSHVVMSASLSAACGYWHERGELDRNLVIPLSHAQVLKSGVSGERPWDFTFYPRHGDFSLTHLKRNFRGRFGFLPDTVILCSVNNLLAPPFIIPPSPPSLEEPLRVSRAPTHSSIRRPLIGCSSHWNLYLNIDVERSPRNDKLADGSLFYFTHFADCYSNFSPVIQPAIRTLCFSLEFIVVKAQLSKVMGWVFSGLSEFQFLSLLAPPAMCQ